MKSIRQVLVVGISAGITLFSATAHAQASTTSVSNSSTGSYSTTSNTFTSPPDSTVHQDYSGSTTNTTKANSSVILGAFAPSMSGYNCAATAQAGASQANAGITAALGIPLLLDPGKMCVYFTAANMSLQQAVAIAPVDNVAAKKLMDAAHNELCNVGEVYEEVRTAQRAAGLDCPLGEAEKTKIDKNVTQQWRFRDAAKPFAPGSDIVVTNEVCGDEPTAACIARVQKRIDWKAKELQTPES
jgi:hypothetical protein